MAYDAEIRVKTKIDNSEVIRLEAELEDVEKKADDAGDALKSVGMNHQAAEAAKEAASGMDELAQKTRKVAEETRQFKKVSDGARIRLADGSTFDWDGNLIEEAIDDTVKLENMNAKLAETTEKVEQSMREMGRETRQVNDAIRGIGEGAGDEVEKQITPLRNMLNFIKQSFKDIPIMLGGIASKSTASTRQMETEWDNLSDKAAHYKGVLEGLGRKGLGFGNTEYDAAYVQWQRAEQEVKEYKDQLAEVKKKHVDMVSGLKKVASSINRIFKKMGVAVKKFFATTNSGAKKTSGVMSALYSRFKGLALSLLIFNWISKGFNAMVSGIGEGYKRFAHYDKEFAASIQSLKNALSTLGNAFASAFSPVIQIAIPALVQLISWITAAVNSVAQLLAALSGKSTWKKATQVQAGYNDELDHTASSAKKAVGALAKFDDLDVWQKNDTAGGGGAGGAEMGGFEEVPIDQEWLDYANWLKEMWESSDFYELGNFLGEKLKEALDNIPWDEIKESARRIAHSIATFINGFIEVEGLGYSIGTTLAQAINTAFEFLNEFVHTIHWDSIGVFIADTLNGFFESIDWDIIYDTFVTGAKGLADAINSFTDWFNWDNASNTISNFVNTFVDTIYTFFSTADWKAIGINIGDQISKTIKRIDWAKAGETFSEVAISILEMIKTGLEEIEWDEVGIAIRDFLVGIDWTTLLKDVGDIISEALNGLVHAAYAALGGNDEEFTKWQENNRKAREEAGKTYEELGIKAEEYLTKQRKITDPSTWDLPVDEMAQKVSEAFDGMMESLSNFCETVGTFLGEKFTEIIESASLKWSEFKIWWDEFWTGIWENILLLWENIKLFFLETWESIKEIANSIWTLIKEFFLKIWGEIRDKAVEVWEKVRSTFEEKMNKVKEKTTEIIKKFEDFKTSVKTVFEAVKSKIEETIKPVIDWIQDFIDKIRDAISAVKDFFASGFEKVGEIVGGIFGGDGRSRSIPESYSPETSGYISTAMSRIPALASGAVIRGGNPFLAILGDQPAGRTNIEAPLSTIERAVENVMGRYGYGGGINPTISLNLDGQEFARLTLQDILNEAARQGYNVEVLGVT